MILIVTAFEGIKRFNQKEVEQGRPVLLIFKLEGDEYQNMPTMIYKKFMNDK